MTNESKTPTGYSTLGKKRHETKVRSLVPPHGTRVSWDEVWMSMAEVIASRSLCVRAQVGCVAVDNNQSVLAVSYNGPPPTYNRDVGLCEMWCERAQTGDTSSYDNCPSNHAEMNALARMSPPADGFTVYINRMCCFTCAKGLAAAGATRVICKLTNYDAHLNVDATVSFLKSCKVQIEFMED